MTNIDWDNAPVTATHYGGGKFWRIQDGGDGWETECAFQWVHSSGSPFNFKDVGVRPQTQPKQKYEYGVEYPTNGQKPDLPDDVLVEFKVGFGPYKNIMGFASGTVGIALWDERVTAFRIIDERYKPRQPTITQELSNKYSRQIVGLDGKTCQIDVYRVLAAFEVDSHPVAHAIKKLLAPGMRHSKSREQDLREAIASIEAELLMMEQSNE